MHFFFFFSKNIVRNRSKIPIFLKKKYSRVICIQLKLFDCLCL